MTVMVFNNGKVRLMKEQTTLKLLLDEFFQRLAAPGAIVLRDTRFPDAPKKIKVAIGMRRSGKTYFLYYYIQKLLNEGIDKNCILYLNFEDDRLSPLNGQKLARLLDAFFSCILKMLVESVISFWMKSKTLMDGRL